MIAVDLFSGCGGSTVGATQAGAQVVWAANHWPAAIDTHMRNHPHIAHVCQDLQQADWTQVPDHDVLCASPSCTGHTRAKGKEAPHHDAARSTAWAVVMCAEAKRPSTIIVENVPEFTHWVLYPAWVAALMALGYTMAKRPIVINAADAGVPQNRRRIFIVASRSRAPLILPQPRCTHVPASTILRFDEGNWSLIDRPNRARATLERIRAGRLTHGDRFLLGYYGSEVGGRSIHAPLGTLTTHDRFAMIDGNRMRMLSVAEMRDGMGFPQNYILPSQRKIATHMLGNAVCPPVMAHVVRAITRIA